MWGLSDGVNNIRAPQNNASIYHKQRTLFVVWLQATNLETQKLTNRIEIHQSQIPNHDILNPLK